MPLKITPEEDNPESILVKRNFLGMRSKKRRNSRVSFNENGDPNDATLEDDEDSTFDLSTDNSNGIEDQQRVLSIAKAVKDIGLSYPLDEIGGFGMVRNTNPPTLQEESEFERHNSVSSEMAPVSKDFLAPTCYCSIS